MKKIIMFFIIIVFVLIILFLIQKKNNLGSKAIDIIKNDVLNNKINIDDYKYIQLEELDNNDIFANCQQGSGVLVTKENNNYSYEDYMRCDNYESIINKKNKKELTGPELIILNKNEEYIELSNKEAVVKEFGNVNVLYYTLDNNAVVKRVVIYTDNKEINVDGKENNDYPSITLSSSDMIMNINEEYQEPGFNAIDPIDGNITKKVQVMGKINNNQIGEYYLKYIIINSRNNYAAVKRRVVIKKDKNFTLTGTCEAKVKSSLINVEVQTNALDKIINYQYIINDQKYMQSTNIFTHEESFTKDNLPKVSVIVSDDDMNRETIECDVKENFVLNVVKDINGYSCLEGFVCYKQKDYSTTYQATSDGPGPLSRNGCLPTSMAIIAAGFGLRSKSGELYTPETLVNEIIYPDGKVWGYSNHERVKYIADKLNLKVSETYHYKNDMNIFREELRKGNLIIFNVTGGCYSTGSHFLTVIGINDKDEMFVSDPWSKNNQSMTKECTVNNWANISEFSSKGYPNYFAVISKE